MNREKRRRIEREAKRRHGGGLVHRELPADQVPASVLVGCVGAGDGFKATPCPEHIVIPFTAFRSLHDGMLRKGGVDSLDEYLKAAGWGLGLSGLPTTTTDGAPATLLTWSVLCPICTVIVGSTDRDDQPNKPGRAAGPLPPDAG